MTAEQLARKFHEAYERLAPSHGYETRKDSAVPWDAVPEKNRNLMIAVCVEILKEGCCGEAVPWPTIDPNEFTHYRAAMAGLLPPE